MNPTMKKLGYGPRDRVVIIHADDIGMSWSADAALADLLEGEAVSSAALMVPCPWFQHAAALCRAHPTVDMGVHLTLNSEFAPYRWGPISTRDPATGMLDDAGYFHDSVAATRRTADRDAVKVELRAQVARAIAEGVDVTHVDAHMLTVAHPPFAESYLSVAIEYSLPLLFPPAESAARRTANSSPQTLADYAALTEQLDGLNMPVFDTIAFLPLGHQPHDLDTAKQVIDSLRPGLTMLILHPAQDTSELRAITPDWPSRVSNYEACRSEDFKRHVRDSGVQVIGYRPLRDLLRGNA